MNILNKYLYLSLIWIVINNDSVLNAQEQYQQTLNPDISTVEPYEYAVEGRQDPFRPFLSPKAATPTGLDPNEIVEDSSELVGMQLFEPGQLTLAGVLLNHNESVALVEDQTKKGYMLKIGTPIGRRGVVTEIQKSQVIITEKAKTRAGQEISSTVIMKLNNEGEK